MVGVDVATHGSNNLNSTASIMAGADADDSVIMHPSRLQERQTANLHIRVAGASETASKTTHHSVIMHPSLLQERQTANLHINVPGASEIASKTTHHVATHGSNNLNSTASIMAGADADDSVIMHPPQLQERPTANLHIRVPGASKTASKTTHHSKKETGSIKFRSYQCEKWQERFLELLEYQRRYGNCLVPHYYSSNRPLARWVKRQRYQYNLLQNGKRSSITSERVKLLNTCGFVWDSHEAAWQEKVQELRDYRQRYGTWMVPSHFPSNPKLANWAKNQRRQYKLYKEGKPTTLSAERILDLENVGFKLESHRDLQSTKRDLESNPFLQSTKMDYKNENQQGNDDDSNSSEVPDIYDMMLDVLSILSSDVSNDESEIVQEYIMQQINNTDAKRRSNVPAQVYPRGETCYHRDDNSDLSDDES